MHSATRLLAVIAVTAALLLPGATLSHAQRPTHTASAMAPTLFGAGPELYLRPSFGPVGTRVQAIGLGFTPGKRVQLRYAPPNADGFSGPFASGMAGADGHVRLSFKISPAMRKASPAYASNPKAFIQFGLLVTASNGKQTSPLTALIVTFG